MSTPLPLIINSDESTSASLQKTIFTNINDNTNQDISAADVRDSLLEVVKGTYGYKTIWDGYIFIDNRDATTTDSRGECKIWQNYYDPNYFIPDSPYNPAEYHRRYQVIANGIGMPPTMHYGVTTETINGEGDGLTFNVGVNADGQGLYFLQVVNQGRYYFSRDTSPYSGLPNANTEDDEVVYLNLPNTGGRPKVRINLRSTLRVSPYNDGNSTQYANEWAFNKLLITLLNGQSRFQRLKNVLPTWTDTMGYQMALDRSLSRIDWPDSSEWFMSMAYNNPNSVTAFHLAQQYVRFGSNIIKGHLELKVPIVTPPM